jgi:hypothetical protein
LRGLHAQAIMRGARMADLEELALRRDRGYLVRLVLLLIAGLVASVLMYGWLTGSSVTGCVAGALGGNAPQTPTPAPPR